MSIRYQLENSHMQHLPHHAHPTMMSTMGRPLWQILLQSASLRRGIQEEIVQVAFPIASPERRRRPTSSLSRPSSGTLSRPTSSTSHRSSINDRDVSPIRRPASATSSHILRSIKSPLVDKVESSGIGVSALREDSFVMRFSLWLSKSRWKDSSMRALELFEVAKLFFEENMSLFTYYMAHECPPVSRPTTQYFQEDALKPEPFPSSLSTDVLLRHRELNSKLQELWDMAPKIVNNGKPSSPDSQLEDQGASSEGPSLLRGTVIQLIVLLYGAFLTSPSLHTPDHIDAVKDLAEADYSAVCGEAMGVGVSSFKCLMLVLIEPFMETLQVAERCEALEMLRPFLFASPGVLRSQTVSLTDSLKELSNSKTVKETYAAVMGGYSNAGGDDDGEGASANEMQKLVDLLDDAEVNPRTRRPASAFSTRSVQRSQSRQDVNLSAQLTSMDTSTTYAQMQLPKWRENLRTQRVKGVSISGKRATAEKRSDVGAASASRSFSLERVMLDRLCKEASQGTVDSNRTRVVRYVGSSVIPRASVEEFVRRHPSTVDRFRRIAETNHLDELGGAAGGSTTPSTSLAITGDLQEETRHSVAAACEMFEEADDRPPYSGPIHNTADTRHCQRVQQMYMRRSGTGVGARPLPMTHSRTLRATPNALPSTLPVWRAQAGHRAVRRPK